MKKMILISLLLLSSFAVSQEFKVALSLSDGTNEQILKLGVHPNGTECYEAALDTFAPPRGPAGTFWAALGTCADFFFVDVRENSMDLKTFVLEFQETVAGPPILSWDSAALPSQWSFQIVDNVTGDLFGPVDMRTTSSLSTDDPFLSAGLRILVMGSTSIGDPDTPLTLAEDFVFYPNYPNPFNGETQFTFTVSRTTNLELAIFNLAGQRVATLLSGQFAPGNHTTAWNGTDRSGSAVSSGVYYGVLRSALQQDVKKLLYVK